MQLNNVLSVVTGTYLGGGGGWGGVVGFGLRGNHGGGGTGRKMTILCAWFLIFLATLSSLSTLRLPPVLVRQRIIRK